MTTSCIKRLLASRLARAFNLPSIKFSVSISLSCPCRERETGDQFTRYSYLEEQESTSRRNAGSVPSGLLWQRAMGWCLSTLRGRSLHPKDRRAGVVRATRVINIKMRIVCVIMVVRGLLGLNSASPLPAPGASVCSTHRRFLQHP